MSPTPAHHQHERDRFRREVLPVRDARACEELRERSGDTVDAEFGELLDLLAAWIRSVPAPPSRPASPTEAPRAELVVNDEELPEWHGDADRTYVAFREGRLPQYKDLPPRTPDALRLDAARLDFRNAERRYEQDLDLDAFEIAQDTFDAACATYATAVGIPPFTEASALRGWGEIDPYPALEARRAALTATRLAHTRVREDRR